MEKKKYVRFVEAAVGDTLRRPVLVTSIKEAVDKNGNTYVKLNLRDEATDLSAMMFKMDKTILANIGVVEGTVADAVIAVSEYNGAKNYRAEKLSPTTDTSVSPSDFMKAPPYPIDDMYNEICDLIKSCDKNLQKDNDDTGEEEAKIENKKETPENTRNSIAELTLKILGDLEGYYKTSSAAVSMHHNMLGGLLYHSYRMVRSADALCGVYDILDRELMICGAALHDIGKIWEYDTSVTGEAEFTPSGILFGHIYLGASLIKRYTEGGNYDMEKVQRLVHMILSHHGTREFGAVVCPATAEAFALHYIDNIDAKLYMCEDFYAQLEEGAITDKKPFGLDNRIYRPRNTDI